MSAVERARPAETMADGTTVRPWGWFDDGPGSPYLATRQHGRLYVMGFARRGMRDAQPVFQVRENGRSGVMQTASEIGPNWPKHPDAALIVTAVNAYDRLSLIEGAARAVIAATNGSHESMTAHDHTQCLPIALDVLADVLADWPPA